MDETAVVILAAGEGKRMHSKFPKVVHRIMGRPLVRFPIELARRLGCRRIVVVIGHGRDAVEEVIRAQGSNDDVTFALQAAQRGTGDAVMSALSALDGHRGRVLILSGDVPLVDEPAIRSLTAAYDRRSGPLAFLSFVPGDPKSYGRVIREQGEPVAIREARDATDEEIKIGEVNAGIYLIDVGFLREAVRRLTADNAQGELYLTDLVAMAAKAGGAAAAIVDEALVSGVNDRADLAMVEAVLRKRRLLDLMKSGVTLRQPETIHVDLDVAIEPDTELYSGVQLLGQTRIGAGCTIGPGTVIADSEIGSGAVIRAYCVIESARVATGAKMGPLVRIGPGRCSEDGEAV